jgi:hypothetical protein
MKVTVPEHHIMKTYGEVEVLLHAFLTLALDGGEWPAPLFSGENSPGISWLIDWLGPQSLSVLGAEVKKTCPTLELNLGFSPCRQSLYRPS